MASKRETTLALAAELKRPLFEAALREAGHDETSIQAWLRRLSRVQLSDEKLARLIDKRPASREPPSVKKQFSIWQHKAAHLLNHKRLSERLVYTSGWVVLLAGATFKAGLSVLGYCTAAVVVLLKARSIWKELDPAHLPLLQRTLNERQLLLHRLLHESQLWTRGAPDDHEVSTFQRSALLLIASYVRDHRSDLKGRTIFVNLLVRRNDRIVVIARSDAKRPLLQSYSADECSLAWAAIDTGIPQVTGDVYRDAPKTAKGKRYSSILVLPITLQDQVLGAVSIDSEEAHHFEGHVDDLEIQLAPYVQLLAITLVRGVAAALPEDQDHGTNSAGIGALPRGSEENFDDSDTNDQRPRP